MNGSIILILLRLFIYYQLLDLAARAGYLNDPILLIIDIALAYIIFMHWMPVFPPKSNNTNNTGG